MLPESDPKTTSLPRGNDVDALFERLGLSPASYRRFEVRRTPQGPVRPKPTDCAPPCGTTHPASPVATQKSAWNSSPHIPIVPRRGDHYAHATPLQRKQGRTQAAARIGLFSLTGGSGKTTIVTNLARFFAEESVACTVINCADRFSFQGILRNSMPLFGAISFLHAPPAATGAPIPVIEAPSGGSLQEPTTQVGGLFQQSMADSNIVLFDLPTTADEPARALLMQMDRILVPLTMEQRTLASLPVLEQLLHKPHGTGPRIQFLINRFNDSSSIQYEMRNRLKSMLGDRLLSICIPDEPAMEEALGHGLTIADYAPSSGAAQQLRRLGIEVATDLAALADTADQVRA